MKMLRMTAEEYAKRQAKRRAAIIPPEIALLREQREAHKEATARPNKYRQRQTGGYASVKEAKRAAMLKQLEAMGEVRRLREQVPYVLLPAQTDPITGEMLERRVIYFADFVYEEKRSDKAWVEVVEDVKGYKDGAAYRFFVLKRKLMLWVHGIRVREV